MKTSPGSKDSTSTKSPDTEDASDNFSLSALMAQGNQSKTAKPSATATKEDSGLIDLNALAGMEDSGRRSPIPDHMGLFPFDAPPIAAAPAPVALPPDITEPPKPKRGLIVLGGVGAVALAGAAFFFGMHGGAATTAGASTSAPATLEAAPAANDPTKAADPDKVVASDPGELKEKEPPKPPVAKGPPTGGQGKLAPGKKDATEAPKEEKKAAPGDPCHGDLLCAMQRATGGKK